MTLAIPVAIAVFALGVYGVLTKRDVIRILFGASLMLSSVTLLAVSVGGIESQLVVLFAWAVEVVEVTFALALFLLLGKQGTHDVTGLRRFRW